MRQLSEDEKSTLSHCAKEAYNKGLAPHHGWAVRQAAKVGLMATPARDTFVTNIKAEKKDFGEMAELINAVKTPLWKYYENNALEKLA